MITQIKAVELAIEALTERRRAKYAAGEAAHKQGIDLEFAHRAHKHYTTHTEAIQQLEDLIEILQDPGAKADPEEQQRRLL